MTQALRIGRWRLAVWSGLAALLLLPLIAMQFTEAMAWDAADFALAAALLVGACLAFELAAWKVRKPAWRAAIGLGLAALVLILWADAAVGVF